jgi:epoxyqueuosine reductase
MKGREMKKIIKDYFSSVNIEYFSVLSYADCRETGKRIMDRESFAPKSVIIYLLPYYAGECENLSIYASSLDYHLAIKEINDGLISLLKKSFPDSGVKGYGDHSPIDERHAALIAGLGIQGDNGLLINESYGSYIFVGDLVTDIEPELLGAELPMPYAGCEGCGACKKACPTGILRGEGSDCLSAITQRKGELTEDEKSLMISHNILWGCDLCQSSCPHNKNPKITPVEFFHRDRIPCLTREILDNMTDEDFEKRAFAWRKRKTIERNLDILNNK